MTHRYDRAASRVPPEVRRLRRSAQTHGIRPCLIWREVDGKIEVCVRARVEHEAPHVGKSGAWWNGQPVEPAVPATVEPSGTPREAPVVPQAARYEFVPMVEQVKVPWTPAPIERRTFDAESVRSGTVAAAMVGELGF